MRSCGLVSGYQTPLRFETANLSLASNAVKPNEFVGHILAASGKAEEARTYYEKALTSAKTIEPDFQVGLAKDLQKKLSSSQ
jgi:hypothetical protein